MTGDAWIDSLFDEVPETNDDDGRSFSIDWTDPNAVKEWINGMY